jgi:hypothetical protein
MDGRKKIVGMEAKRENIQADPSEAALS